MKTIKVTKDRVKEVLAAIREMDATRVLVGVPSDNDQPHKGYHAVGPNMRTEPNAPSNAELAYIHDNGAPEVNIPARPSMEPGIARTLPTSLAHLETAGIAMLTGDKQWFEQEMDLAGFAAVEGIRQTIEDGIPPPLSPSTIAGRRRRGVTGTTPLIDTRQLIDSISFITRRK